MTQGVVTDTVCTETLLLLGAKSSSFKQIFGEKFSDSCEGEQSLGVMKCN